MTEKIVNIRKVVLCRGFTILLFFLQIPLSPGKSQVLQESFQSPAVHCNHNDKSSVVNNELKSTSDIQSSILSGVNIAVGYTGSFWVTNIDPPLRVKTYGNKMGYFEAWYSKPLIRITEGLRILDRPYINFQTDFGFTTSSDLISVAEPSSLRPEGNMRLLVQINIVNPIFVRYRKEIFVAELFSDSDFNYIPYKGEPSVIPSGSRLYMVSEFHDMEIGLSLAPFREKGSIIEVGIYHSVWQRPRTVNVAEVPLDEDIYYNVYHGIQDFWGLLFGASGIAWRKDEDGGISESVKAGYYFKGGGGTLKLSSQYEQPLPLIEDAGFTNLEAGIYWRYYWRIASSLDFGADFRYIYQFTGLSGEYDNNDYRLTEDHTIFITALVQFSP